MTLPFVARRLAANPIIGPATHPAAGHNIQGPSLIRVPGWVPNPLGRYYLYFADHKGDAIRLAFADAIEGPWKLHPPGALRLEDSLYPTEPPDRPEGHGFAPRQGMAPPRTPGVPPREVDAVITHIASPDVHVDEANRRIVMYYHGLVGYADQQSRVALSPDGLSFTPRPELLGPSYFRVFAHGGATYAVVMPGFLYRSADGLSGFERGPDLFGDPLQRHTALLRRGDALWVFWTRVGDVPERILVSKVDLVGDWQAWRAGPAAELMRPEAEWEGAALPPGPSYRGAINQPVNQLRDPCIFEEDGRTWLLYAVAGESGIAVAELEEG